MDDGQAETAGHSHEKRIVRIERIDRIDTIERIDRIERRERRGEERREKREKRKREEGGERRGKGRELFQDTPVSIALHLSITMNDMMSSTRTNEQVTAVIRKEVL